MNNQNKAKQRKFVTETKIGHYEPNKVKQTDFIMKYVCKMKKS